MVVSTGEVGGSFTVDPNIGAFLTSLTDFLIGDEAITFDYATLLSQYVYQGLDIGYLLKVLVTLAIKKGRDAANFSDDMNNLIVIIASRGTKRSKIESKTAETGAKAFKSLVATYSILEGVPKKAWSVTLGRIGAVFAHHVTFVTWKLSCLPPDVLTVKDASGVEIALLTQFYSPYLMASMKRKLFSSDKDWMLCAKVALLQAKVFDLKINSKSNTPQDLDVIVKYQQVAHNAAELRPGCSMNCLVNIGLLNSNGDLLVNRPVLQVLSSVFNTEGFDDNIFDGFNR